MGMNECRVGRGGNMKMCEKWIDRMAYCMNWFNYICSAFLFSRGHSPAVLPDKTLNHPQPVCIRKVHVDLVILENQSLPSNL